MRALHFLSVDTRTVARVVVIVCLVSLTAASPGRLSAQTAAPALAPRLGGLSDLHMPVSTQNAGAQAFFDQGLRLLYAFNHAEARRAFREAARLDARLAMAHWGEAMTLAVNLNAPMSADSGRQAHDAAHRARALSGPATALERTLIDALVQRFATDPAAPRPPLDRAYAEAMTRAAAAYSGHPDVQTLYADAVMNTMPWDYWQKDGTLKPAAEPIRRALERAVQASPQHAGAHHYYIHLMEGSSTPEAAEASADRLIGLMPAAGHMVHMPAHIYLRVGRYADAAEANVRAIAADEDYLAQCQAQGLYPVSYYPHNLHFLWVAATLEGRSGAAIEAARQVAVKVPHHHAGALAWTADFPVTPWLAYVRFGRWQEILTEPKPPVSEPYATGIWHYARGLAFVARGDIGRAEAELAALTATLEHEAFRTTLKDLPLLTNLQIASRIVRGELASRGGRHDDARRVLREAVALEDAMPYSEPPLWHQPVRQVLGAVLLAAQRPAEAEVEDRAELARFRENGWSLFGLWQSLVAQHRTDEAQQVRARFDKAWARADVSLTSSRVMPAAQPLAAANDVQPVTGGPMEKFVSLSTGVRMEYVEQGQPDGVPVVFLHGVTDSWQSFAGVLQRLPPTIHGFAISQRGHGDTSRPDAGYGYSDFSDDLAAFMDAVGLRRATIVGHSMGTLVAQRFVRDHPDRVAGLVLIGAFASLYRDPGIIDFYTSAILPLADPIDAGFAREWQESTLARAMAPDHLDTVVAETQKVPARVWRAAFQGFLNTPDSSDALSQVSVPTLIMWGDRDTYALRANQDRLRSVIPGARLRVYEGAGHALHWEDPAACATELMAFVRQLPVGAGSLG
jgi:pimeloyl-ACP methyl ester carboxylesterase/tetratricopeptide (TPR) repeat protein